MDLWIPLIVAALAFLFVGGIILRRWQVDREGNAAPTAAGEEAEAPSKPVKRRRNRIIKSDMPPPPPPPPAEVGPEAAAPEEVSFEKLLDLVDVNLETDNVALAGHYLEEVRSRFMDKPPVDYFRRRAVLCAKQGDAEGEADALVNVVAITKEEIAPLVRLAELELQLERLAGARHRIEEALVANPNDLALLHILAKIHRKADEHEQAVAVKQRIHALEQDLRLRGELPPDPEELAPTPTSSNGASPER